MKIKSSCEKLRGGEKVYVRSKIYGHPILTCSYDCTNSTTSLNSKRFSQSCFIILIMNKIKENLDDCFKRKRTQIIFTSYNVCNSTAILKLEMTICVVRNR